MNPIFERTDFNASDIPAWPCPSCGVGRLEKKDDKFDFEMDSASKINYREDWCDPDQLEFVFTCMLECKHCEGAVAVTGTGQVWENHDDSASSRYYETYTPSFFQPALNIISFPSSEKLPDIVRQSLEKSFPLFWCDFDACASRIRATLELLLDAMGIPRKINENAFRELTLHDRIEKIPAEPGSEQEEVKHMMMALKWMGNAGAHEVQGVERKQIIHAYKMIEICLARLYPTVDPEIKKMVTIAREIIAAKKKPRL